MCPSQRRVRGGISPPSRSPGDLSRVGIVLPLAGEGDLNQNGEPMQRERRRSAEAFPEKVSSPFPG